VKKLITLISLLITATAGWANGGPVDGSSVLVAGEPRFLHYADIELTKEILSFTVRDNWIDIVVEYRLKNMSTHTGETIDYGFPVDYDMDIYSELFNPEENEELVKGLTFSLNGRALSVETHVDMSVFERDIQSIYGERTKLKRTWYFTRFTIDKQQDATLQISYSLKANFIDFATSKSFFTHYSPRQLYWDFSPAQYWGNGIVGDLEINVNMESDRIRAGSLTSSLPFAKEGDTYRFIAKDYDLTNTEPLLIMYDLNVKADFISKYNLFHQDIFKGIKASSAQKNYPAANLKDGNYATAWVPDGDGVGAWVEIETAPCYVGAIIMVGGYMKSEETYFNNNRPKSIKIEYLRSDYESDEYSWEEQVIDLNDVPFVKGEELNLLSHVVFDLGDIGFKIKKIRITILDVYKGTKYNDTCISEIYVLGYLPDFDNY
jgi:hypothetical protein